MKIRIHDARLAFPQIWEPKAVNDEGPAKFSATFIIDPQSKDVAALKKAMGSVAKDKWGEKAASIYKQLMAADRLALHDGDSKNQYAGFEGNLFINARNDIRPTIVAQDGRTPLAATDGRPYAGAFVNAVLELWAQDNRYGKRINASLMGIQFVRDGERLAGGAVASEDDFEALPDAESDDLGFEGEATEGSSDLLDDDIPF